jgi:hypothetical protein
MTSVKSLAKKTYEEQLQQHTITPHIPPIKEIMSVYKEDEILIR